MPEDAPSEGAPAAGAASAAAGPQSVERPPVVPPPAGAGTATPESAAGARPEGPPPAAAPAASATGGTPVQLDPVQLLRSSPASQQEDLATPEIGSSARRQGRKGRARSPGVSKQNSPTTGSLSPGRSTRKEGAVRVGNAWLDQADVVRILGTMAESGSVLIPAADENTLTRASLSGTGDGELMAARTALAQRCFAQLRSSARSLAELHPKEEELSPFAAAAQSEEEDQRQGRGRRKGAGKRGRSAKSRRGGPSSADASASDPAVLQSSMQSASGYASPAADSPPESLSSPKAVRDALRNSWEKCVHVLPHAGRSAPPDTVWQDSLLGPCGSGANELSAVAASAASSLWCAPWGVAGRGGKAASDKPPERGTPAGGPADSAARRRAAFPRSLPPERAASCQWAAAWTAASQSPAGAERDAELRRVLTRMLDATLPIAEALAVRCLLGEEVPRRHIEASAVFRIAPACPRTRHLCGGHDGVHRLFGHELRGLAALSRVRGPQLHCPPAYIADLAGCRVLVVACCPVETLSCIYGSTELRLGRPTVADTAPRDQLNHPHPVIKAEDVDAAEAMRMCAQELRLAGHWVGRLHRRRFLYGPADIQVHRSEGDNRLYVLKARRLLPPDSGSSGQPAEFLTRRLRAEALCSGCTQDTAVSSDALSPLGDHLRPEHDGAARRLAEWVLTEQVPKAVDDLCQAAADRWQPEVVAALLHCGGCVTALHRRGACCRHLGAAAACSRLAAPRPASPEETVLSALRMEMTARVLKVLLRRAARTAGWRGFSAAVLALLQGVFHYPPPPEEDAPPKGLWATLVWPEMTAKFGKGFESFHTGHLQLDALFHKLCEQSGLRVQFDGAVVRRLDASPIPEQPFADLPGLNVGVATRVRAVPLTRAHQEGDAALLCHNVIAMLSKLASGRPGPATGSPLSTLPAEWVSVAGDALRYAAEQGREGEASQFRELLAEGTRGLVRAVRRKRQRSLAAESTCIFRYPAASGETLQLDSSDAGLAPWRVCHGMRLRLTDGVTSLKGPSGAHVTTTVLGVHEGQLWRCDDGDIGARPFFGSGFAELMGRYAFVWIGHEVLQEGARSRRRPCGLAGPKGLERLGPRGVLQEFGISRRSCARFGFYYGDRLQYTAVRDPEDAGRLGVVTSVLGVFCDSAAGPHLWVHDDGGAFPCRLRGGSFQELMQLYGLRLCDRQVTPELLQHPGEAAIEVGERVFAAGYRAMHLKHGLHHSQRVRHTEGPYKGTVSTVVGIASDPGETLWVIRDSTGTLAPLGDRGSDGERGVAQNRHGLQVIGCAQLPVAPRRPREPFPYPTVWDDQVAAFDRSCSACEPFGLFHGQRFKIIRGPHVGAVGTIIGVSDRAVWGHLEGEQGARPLRHEDTVPLGVLSAHTTVRAAALSSHWKRVQGTISLSRVTGGLLGVGPARRVEPRRVSAIAQQFADGVRIAERQNARWRRVALAAAKGEDVDCVDPLAERRRSAYEGAETAARTESKQAQKAASFMAFSCLSCTGEVLLMSTAFRACAPFGLYFGQLVDCGDGSGLAVVVGATRGELWRLHQTEHAARPFRGGCWVEIRARYPAIRVVGLADSIAEFEDPLIYPGGTVTRTNYSHIRVGPEVYRHRTLQGDEYGFDCSREALKPFGFLKGDRVQRRDETRIRTVMERQPDGTVRKAFVPEVVGPKAVVVGVVAHRLWVHLDGAPGAQEVPAHEEKHWRLLCRHEEVAKAVREPGAVPDPHSRYNNTDRAALLLRAPLPAVETGAGGPPSPRYGAHAASIGSVVHYVWEYAPEGTSRLLEDDSVWQPLAAWQAVDQWHAAHNRQDAVPVTRVDEPALSLDPLEVNYKELKLYSMQGREWALRSLPVYACADYAASQGFDFSDPPRHDWRLLLEEKAVEAFRAQHGGRSPPRLDADGGRRSSGPAQHQTAGTPVFYTADLSSAVAPALALTRKAYMQVLRRHACEVTEPELQVVAHRFSSFRCIAPVLRWALLSYGALDTEPADGPEQIRENLRLAAALERYHGTLCTAPTQSEFAELCQKRREVVQSDEAVARGGQEGQERRMRRILCTVCVDALAQRRMDESEEGQMPLEFSAKWAHTKVDRVLEEMLEHAVTVDGLQQDLLAAVRRGAVDAALALEAELMSHHINIRNAGSNAVVSVLGIVQNPESGGVLSAPKRNKLLSLGTAARRQMLKEAVELSATGRLRLGRTASPKDRRTRVQTGGTQGEEDAADSKMGGVTLKDCGPIERLRDSVFPYTLASGETAFFDTRPESCAVFGYSHGQRVRCGVGDLEGRCAVILGVLEGALWRYEEPPAPGERRTFVPLPATPYAGEDKDDIDRLHQLCVITERVRVRPSDPFAFLTHTGPVAVYDVSDDACEAVFGARHGERYAVPTDCPEGAQFGDLPPGGCITIIGVHDGQLWWACDRAGAWRFPQQSGPVPRTLGLQLLYTASVCAYSPEAVRRVQLTQQHPQEQGRGRGPPCVCLDISDAALKPYGLQFGDCVLLGRGPLCGEIVTVAGVRRRRLYASRRSAPGTVDKLPGDGPAGLMQACKPQRTGQRMPAHILDDEEEAVFKVVPIDDTATRCTERQREFHYLTTGGVALFDITPEALMPWGLKHGDVLLLRTGPLQGRQATVVGVKRPSQLQGRPAEGAPAHSSQQKAAAVLSWDVDDCGWATPASGCPRMEQLAQLFDPVVVGTATLREFLG
eukprot:TRINITY_DN23169_c0_g1_i1.p1 TRINITY_DN23169_c0_g1~~TRINITY_DN23169_c0_g1_i1.p1  ORF type:complete len:2724 (+),score=643.65 TRINITY_DN23169_c0_g1_i1:84-8174(+)